MARELNLDQLSEAMRKRQEGNKSGKKIVWDKNTMSFVELDTFENPTETQSVVNDVSKRPFFSLQLW